MNAITRISDVNASVEGWRDDFSRVLSSDVDPDKFIAAVTTALTLNPDIARECTAESIKNACIKAAYDGLRPDGKEGALVAYYNKDIKAKEATWMPMVFGLRKKAKDHDDIIITTREVRQGDEFSVVYGLKEDLKHVPLLSEKKRGPIVATYAVFRRGEEILHFEVMTKEDIDQVRSASKAPNSPAWNNWYGEMGKKAAANRGSKSVPMSDAVRQIIDRDNDHYDLNGIKDVTPSRAPLGRALQAGKSSASEGFSLGHVQSEIGGRQIPMEIIDQETGEVIEVARTEAQSASPVKETMGGRKAEADSKSAAPASEKPSSGPGPSTDGDDGRAGSTGSTGNQPQNSSPPPSGDDGGGDGGSKSFTPLSAATLREINVKLARFTSEESVKRGYSELCKAAGYMKQAISEDDAAFLKSIAQAHLSRVAGEAKIETCIEAVDAAISETYPEDKL